MSRFSRLLGAVRAVTAPCSSPRHVSSSLSTLSSFGRTSLPGAAVSWSHKTATLPFLSVSSSVRCISTSPLPLPARGIALNTLSDNPKATRPRIRWGRGVGSGKGKTAGRGHKGSHARNSRGLKPWFIGGQTPLYKLFPKRGFRPPNPRPLTPLNLDRLVDFIQQRRIDPALPITMKTMLDTGLVSKPPKFGVKLLARGHRLPREDGPTHKAVGRPRPPLPPLRLEVSDASESAKKAVEAVGGEVKLVWYNRLGLRYLLKPEKFEGPPKRAAIPPPRFRRKYTQQLVGRQRPRSKMGDIV